MLVYGANIPCMEKVDNVKIPSVGMDEFCKKHPSGDMIPAYITGRKNLYEWRCIDEKPIVVKQVHPVDDRGFIKTYWHELQKE